MDIPCDYCLEFFHNLRDFEIHLSELHEKDPSICILCYQSFPPFTRRWNFEKHVTYDCKASKYKIVEIEIPFADGLRLSTNNKRTPYWIVVKGQRYFLTLEKTPMSERKTQPNIPKICPLTDSPIIHYSNLCTIKLSK